MKLKVTMKDHDGVIDSVYEAVSRDVKALGLPQDEAESLIEQRTDKVKDCLARWFRFSEYVTLEVDTEAKTAVVCDA